VIVIFGKIPHYKLWFSPFTIAYYLGSWPGLKLAQLFKLVEFLKPAEASPRKSPERPKQAPAA
jgi:hypothetical protein